MTPDRWKQIGAILDRILDAPPDARAAALADACREQGIEIADAEPYLADETRYSKFLSGLDPVVVSRALASMAAEPLTAGARLGPYEIIGPLGAGGMGEVYRARDTLLRREVALKLLPPLFMKDPDRVSRFSREAQALAALSHPNIGAIHGLQEHLGGSALVLELVEGRTLEELIGRRGLPVAEALNIARQIADALVAAHGQGIVHRDLKPSNIKIRSDGFVKVLDFGLAKLMDDPAEVGADSTQARLILGTAAYMSPEQASGSPVDKRADVWAFGCLLYEMLSGRPPFRPESVSGTLALVQSSDPDWSTLPPAIPAPLRRLLRRCLVKDPRHRLADVADARFEIDEALAPDTAAEQAHVAPRRARYWVWSAAIAANVLALVGLWSWLRPMVPTAPVVMRFTSPAALSRAGVPALSPDGTRLAYQRQAAQPGAPTPSRRIYIRTIDELEARPLAGTDDAMDPAFSPDGNWLAFLTSSSQTRSPLLSNLRQLKKVPVTGGEAQTLAEGITPGWTELEWNQAGWIYFTNADSVLRVRSSGGAVETLATVDPARDEFQFNAPQSLPRSDVVIFSIATDPNLTGTRVVALDIRTRERRTLLEDAGIARYVASGPGPDRGHLVYGRDGAMFAVAFDAIKQQLIGSPVRVLDGVRGLGPRRASFGFSATGTLVYVPDVETAVSPLWVDRHGSGIPLALPPGQYFAPTIVPNGDRVALLMRRGTDDERTDLWVHEFRRGILTRLSFEGNNLGQIWSPDGKQLIYVSETPSRPHALVAIAADGSGAAQLLLNPHERHVPTAITPDGRTLIVRRDKGTGAAVSSAYLTLTLPAPSGPVAPAPLLESATAMGRLSLSPDGKWAAYEARESGRGEIYVMPFPTPNRRWQISTDGGIWPVWSSNGRELFYRNRQDVMSVRVDTSPTFRSRPPVALFSGRYRPVFDVDRDGQRFLMLRLADAPPTEHHVVINWFEELRRRAPAADPANR
jgi:serine/threonine-protein kinase